MRGSQWVLTRNAGPTKGQTQFQCHLSCMRCKYTIPSTHKRCARRVCVGVPYCFQHIRPAMNLRYGPSTIPGIKGLFAWDASTKGAGKRCVFKRGQRIAYYTGERLTLAQTNTRYDYHTFDPTAPYAIRLSDGSVVDAACCRGIGSLINDPKGVAGASANVELDDDIIRATDPIYNGEELFAEYEGLYWRNSRCPARGKRSGSPECFVWRIRQATKPKSSRRSRCTVRANAR